MANEDMRIGDHERDEAITLLQEHMSAGRLTTDEFNERMSRALEARTWRDLGVLFTDLPGRRPMPPDVPTPAVPAPGMGWVAPAPTYGASPDTPEVRQHGGKPWYSQWWILMVAILVTTMSSGRLGFLLPAVAIWIWVIAPALDRERQRRRPAVSAPPRPLTFYEREELLDEIRAGRPISAVKRYRELTGADLYTAKMTVDALRREIGR